ncbi:MAG: tRNA dihydrouridine synthase DusB [Thermodesulfobacteriota bacterium]|nr:tRNA dihydrouridine synthase DusB [Thermodesulfobacteriota bacterium]
MMNGVSAMAPLAGITNLPFRLIVKQCGCPLVYTEMVSAKGLLYNSKKTFALLDSRKKDRPLNVQIFGSDPGDMADAAAIIQEKGCGDIIDINFGCSVKKVLKTGAGAALMQAPDRAAALLKAVRQRITLPLTIKIRSGWDCSGNQAAVIAQIAQDCGVDAVAVHPRTAQQGFRGKADWTIIKRIKQKLSIPVLGNGDIVTPELGVDMMKQTGCDGVMIGRAAMGNPFIFSALENLLNHNTWSKPSLEDIVSVMKTLLSAHVTYFGEKAGVKMMRSRLTWFAKGYPGAKDFRKNLTGIESCAHALDIINEFKENTQAGALVCSPPK